MSNQQSNENAMVLSPRQEQLQRVRDNMAPGEKPAAIVPHTFAELIVMCDALAKADLAPKALRGKATDMALVIMTGAEVGIPPMAALRLYTTWDGVPRLMAEGMRAIILAHPECEWFRRVRGSDKEVVWSTKRRGQPEQTCTWTIERAKQAELLNKETWRKYPESMLDARCSMQLARLEWPDVVAGMLSKEEAMDGDFIEVQGTEPKFVAPPPPQGPPPGVAIPPSSHAVGDAVIARTAQAVTVTDTGTKPTEPRRGPGRPPGSKNAERPTVPATASAQSPGSSGSPSASASPPPTAGPSVPPPATAASPSPETNSAGSADPTSSAGSPSSSTTETATSAPSATDSAASAPSDDGFGGEDPEDSQPAPPTGDPGLALIAEFQKFLADCKSQQEMQAGSAPFRQRSAALFRDGDQRFAAPAAGKPAGELAGRMTTLWAERKSQVPA